MSQKSENEEQELQALNMKERRAISVAFAALAGQANIASFQSFTFEEALDAGIERIKGTTGLRTNLLNKTNITEQGLLAVVEQLKAAPPESFVDPSPEEDVAGNTA